MKSKKRLNRKKGGTRYLSKLFRKRPTTDVLLKFIITDGYIDQSFKQYIKDIGIHNKRDINYYVGASKPDPKLISKFISYKSDNRIEQDAIEIPLVMSVLHELFNNDKAVAEFIMNYNNELETIKTLTVLNRYLLKIVLVLCHRLLMVENKTSTISSSVQAEQLLNDKLFLPFTGQGRSYPFSVSRPYWQDMNTNKMYYIKITPRYVVRTQLPDSVAYNINDLCANTYKYCRTNICDRGIKSAIRYFNIRDTKYKKGLPPIDYLYVENTLNGINSEELSTEIEEINPKVNLDNIPLIFGLFSVNNKVMLCVFSLKHAQFQKPSRTGGTRFIRRLFGTSKKQTAAEAAKGNGPFAIPVKILGEGGEALAAAGLWRVLTI